MYNPHYVNIFANHNTGYATHNAAPEPSRYAVQNLPSTPSGFAIRSFPPVPPGYPVHSRQPAGYAHNFSSVPPGYAVHSFSSASSRHTVQRLSSVPPGYVGYNSSSVSPGYATHFSASVSTGHAHYLSSVPPGYVGYNSSSVPPGYVGYNSSSVSSRYAKHNSASVSTGDEKKNLTSVPGNQARNVSTIPTQRESPSGFTKQINLTLPTVEKLEILLSNLKAVTSFQEYSDNEDITLPTPENLEILLNDLKAVTPLQKYSDTRNEGIASKDTGSEDKIVKDNLNISTSERVENKNVYSKQRSTATGNIAEVKDTFTTNVETKEITAESDSLEIENGTGKVNGKLANKVNENIDGIKIKRNVVSKWNNSSKSMVLSSRSQQIKKTEKIKFAKETYRYLKLSKQLRATEGQRPKQHDQQTTFFEGCKFRYYTPDRMVIVRSLRPEFCEEPPPFREFCGLVQCR